MITGGYVQLRKFAEGSCRVLKGYFVLQRLGLNMKP